jgi:hypothetical protein
MGSASNSAGMRGSGATYNPAVLAVLKSRYPDEPAACRRYNGAGPAAELYAVDVMQMRRWSAAVAQPMSEGQAPTNETSVA